MASLRQGLQVDLEDSLNRVVGGIGHAYYLKIGRLHTTALSGTETYYPSTVISQISAGGSLTITNTTSTYSLDQSISISNVLFKFVNASIFMDQPGTLAIQQTFDGTNYDLINSVTVAASTGIGLQALFMGVNYRIVISNTGAGATTVIRMLRFFGPA